jgi:hypothetical protein
MGQQQQSFIFSLHLSLQAIDNPVHAAERKPKPIKGLSVLGKHVAQLVTQGASVMQRLTPIAWACLVSHFHEYDLCADQ